MKGLGNYRNVGVTEERRHGVLVMYRGDRAVVRFHNGDTFAVPADKLKSLGVEPDGRFVMTVSFAGGAVRGVRFEQPAQARPQTDSRQAPKIYRRDGRRVVTR